MRRIAKVAERLREWQVDLLLVDHPIDLFYLTGELLTAGLLVIQERESTLYVDGRYYERCRARLPLTVQLQGRDHPLPTYKGMRIGFDAHTTSFAQYERLAELEGERVPLSHPLQTIRMVKEEEELVALRSAARLCSQGYDFVVAHLEEGVTEQELARELELFWRRSGGERVGFTPHIAFGSHTAYPHYQVGNTPLRRGDLVMIDIGVVVDQYHSDMTRVLFFEKADPQLVEVYQVVKKAQQQAFALCKPGTALAELDRAARQTIEAAGYGPYFVHSLGHGVGLEIHELPTLRAGVGGVVEAGMVFTIEPGVYLPEVGGVRLEDTIIITEEGYESITERPLPASPYVVHR